MQAKTRPSVMFPEKKKWHSADSHRQKNPGYQKSNIWATPWPKFQFSLLANGLKHVAQTFDYDRNIISFYDLDALLTQRNVLTDKAIHSTVHHTNRGW